MPRDAPPGWFPRRGDVCWVTLDKKRPAVVLSVDALNRHALDVCVVPLTTVHRAPFALRVPIRAGEGGVKSDSWAKCDQIATVAKSLLVCPVVGRIGRATLGQIEEAVRTALGLFEG